MEFLDEKLEEYVNQHTSPESKLLNKLNRQTHISVLQPRMLSGHLQGRTLSLFSKMLQPKRILEIGTYTGYSAICLAEGLKENGKLITIDVNYELEEMVNSYIKEADLSDKIEMKVGNALEIIPDLNKNFDLVFIDADKSNYAKYYDLLIEDLPSGAILIADNVLWSGKVLEETKKNDVDTEALKIFNKKIQEDDRVENVLMPIRDGLMVIRKK
ncbi:O-methyltransferase [Brumimicrobium aurantiacum]|uniref:O-methyltransferase n=1 Tax=Brumimicrobium aurantiacum TaxID=1737063 RepID=A0A3E1EWJ8_9FLAO|nr:O-methyltransferase [Brumimicrobium aurantiacum]RFC53934.1 O-methyltransferase [Brumimicrobium aurantiacum]